MPRIVKSTTNARRKMSFADFQSLTKKRPERSLTVSLRKHAGRDKFGHISVRHQGGGSKRLYRVIDFKMLPFDGQAKVISVEYDPNRSGFIALIELPSGEKRYMLAPDKLAAGDRISSGVAKKFQTGNRLTLGDIPVGTEVSNVELQPGRGGQLARSAGSWAIVSAKEGKFVHLKLPSSEVRKVLVNCMATIGRVSNPTHNRIRLSKAGRSRLMGIRPSVRGKAMYPAAHPHGGGEGVSPIGLKRPKSPWGKPAIGGKTRRNQRTNVF
jgi:large subunit ribosomal protein L2